VRAVRILVALLIAVAGGCDFMFMNEFAIGRRCSDADECPRAQRCSADGQCLELCPSPGCVGDQCGCVATGTHGDSSEYRASCRDDGLCHWICGATSCGEGMVCVIGVCFAGCPDGYCPHGRTCENASNPDQAYCRDASGI
jgi:hypothetical protein